MTAALTRVDATITAAPLDTATAATASGASKHDRIVVTVEGQATTITVDTVTGPTLEIEVGITTTIVAIIITAIIIIIAIITDSVASRPGNTVVIVADHRVPTGRKAKDIKVVRETIKAPSELTTRSLSLTRTRPLPEYPPHRFHL